MQTETLPIQDAAIQRLLSVDSPFFRALVKLSTQPEYSYDLVTTALPVTMFCRYDLIWI